MAAFVEQRSPQIDQIGKRSSVGPTYDTTVIEQVNGNESRNANWSYPKWEGDLQYGIREYADIEAILRMFHVCQGKAGGFLLRDYLDYKSCALDSVIAATDQLVGSGDGVTTTFQLVKNYAVGSDIQQRLVRKPEPGTVLLAIGTQAQTLRWSVDTTTGIVTFDADIVGTVTAATSTNPVTLTIVGHGLTTGESVYLSTFTGGFAALNDTREIVTVTGVDTFTIPVDGSAFAAWAAGGAINTLPQTGETIAAGYEFNVPVRFDTDSLAVTLDSYAHGGVSVPVVEDRRG